MFNRIITTMNSYEVDQKTEGGVIDTSKTKGSLKEYQEVLAVGDTVKGIKVGDIVCINPTRYSVINHNNDSLRQEFNRDKVVVGYKFNTININGNECLVLYDQDIDFIVEESVEEEIEEPKQKLIVPPKSKLIVP